MKNSWIVNTMNKLKDRAMNNIIDIMDIKKVQAIGKLHNVWIYTNTRDKHKVPNGYVPLSCSTISEEKYGLVHIHGKRYWIKDIISPAIQEYAERHRLKKYVEQHGVPVWDDATNGNTQQNIDFTGEDWVTTATVKAHFNIPANTPIPTTLARMFPRVCKRVDNPDRYLYHMPSLERMRQVEPDGDMPASFSILDHIKALSDGQRHELAELILR